jgi:hypothetical protein
MAVLDEQEVSRREFVRGEFVRRRVEQLRRLLLMLGCS